MAVHVFISRRNLFDLPFALIAQPLDEATIQEHLIFAWRPAVLQDAGLRYSFRIRSRRADQTDGQKTEDLSDLARLLRSGDRCAIHEGRSGGVGRRQQSLSS